jgi:hypothetical protein
MRFPSPNGPPPRVAPRPAHGRPRLRRRCGLKRQAAFSARPPEMDRRPEPRTRSRQTKLRRGPGSPFCLVEQGYGVCGARDERAHAAQQQQLVDQLGHDCPPQGRFRQNHNWEQELWFRDGMRTDRWGFYCPDEGRPRESPPPPPQPGPRQNRGGPQASYRAAGAGPPSSGARPSRCQARAARHRCPSPCPIISCVS